MGNYNRGLREQLSVVSCIDPDAYTAATYTGDVIDMQDFRRVIFILQAGDLGSSATLDYRVEGSAVVGLTSSGTVGTAATQLTDSNKQVVIEVTAEQVAALGYRYIRDEMIVKTATSDCGSIALGQLAHYSPASEYDLASVDEILP
jgi:hypothetical protein